MGFEDTRDDFWRDRGDDSHSKKNFLRALVQAGAVMTGRELGVEVPYDGARGHAEELEFEGLARRCSQQPISDTVIWLPTDEGRRAC